MSLARFRILGMSRVLIASPPVARGVRHYDRAFMPFLGMGYLASTMRAQGHTVRVADSHLGRIDFLDLLHLTDDFLPDIVGLSAMTHEIRQAYEAARSIKRRHHSIRIVLGGAHANAQPCEALEECAALDATCFGEGEGTFAEMANRWTAGETLAECPGVAWRDQAGPARRNPPRPWSPDLDSLPFPAWDLFPASDTYPVMSARGCSFRCNFCCRALGDRVRLRSPANTVAEIEWVVRTFRPRLIRFEDETLGWDLRHIGAILDGIMAKGLHRAVEFSGQTRVDRAEPQLFRTLRQANFRLIEMGVESGNGRILAASGKRIDVDRVREAFAAAHEAGLRTWAKFILGHPNETVETLRDTLDLATRINPSIVSFAIMVPYPGTAVWDLARRGEGGYRIVERDWTAFDKFLGNALALEHLSRAALERWQMRGYAEVYLRNRRFREFVGLVWEHRKMAGRLAWKLLHSAGPPVRRSPRRTSSTTEAGPSSADDATGVGQSPGGAGR
jgi:anaerobic magnesium-protoporphyrin IX monomethyl ester cyclase